MKFLLGISRVIDAVTGAFGRFVWWVSLLMVLVGAFNVIQLDRGAHHRLLPGAGHLAATDLGSAVTGA